MFADHFESVLSIYENVLCVTKFPCEVVELLLVREADFEILIRIWYGDLLVLQNPVGFRIRTGTIQCSNHRLDSRGS